MRAVLIRPDNTWEIQQLDRGDELRQLQGLVGGYVQAPPLGSAIADKPAITLWCNEEGKYQDLPVNAAATQFWWDTFGMPAGTVFDDEIVGTVVITGTTGERSTDVPTWVIEKLRAKADG